MSLDQADAAWHVHAVPIPGTLSRLEGAQSRNDEASTTYSATEQAVTSSSQLVIGGQDRVCSTAAFLGLGPGLMLAGAFSAALVVMMVLWTGTENGSTTSILDGAVKVCHYLART